jgi:hypothetical protein
MPELAKISFASSGALFELSFRASPDSLSCPYASSYSASNFVNTAITGAEKDAITSQQNKDVIITNPTFPCVALRKKLSLGAHDRTIVLIHWDAIPAIEKIIMK